jgi:hypothetical protein
LKLTWLGLAAALAPTLAATLAWTKALVEAGEREMAGVTCCTGWIWCCRGEVSGEPLEREERSDEAEWMECSYKVKYQQGTRSKDCVTVAADVVLLGRPTIAP